MSSSIMEAAHDGHQAPRHRRCQRLQCHPIVHRSAEVFHQEYVLVGIVQVSSCMHTHPGQQLEERGKEDLPRASRALLLVFEHTPEETESVYWSTRERGATPEKRGRDERREEKRRERREKREKRRHERREKRDEKREEEEVCRETRCSVYKLYILIMYVPASIGMCT